MERETEALTIVGTPNNIFAIGEGTDNRSNPHSQLDFQSAMRVMKHMM